jgi:HAD superfamily hydrolase (TIGR01484 family)
LVTPPRPGGRFRILALDVDGTLLDGSGTLRAATAEAVARAAAAGLRPVLCTGRRYRRARPVALRLGLDAPLVCNSGAIVKDPADGRTLWRADLPPATLGALLDAFAHHDEPAVSFLDGDLTGPDFRVAAYPTGRPLFDDYVGQNREHAAVDADWARHGGGPHFHLCAIGPVATMREVEATVHARLAGQVRTFVQRVPRYLGTMCEVLHAEASKWSAVLHVAEAWGVKPEEIVAVGDDRNDVPMLRGAGLGVAMPHAPEEVLAAADLIADPHDADGLARLVDELLRA